MSCEVKQLLNFTQLLPQNFNTLYSFSDILNLKFLKAISTLLFQFGNTLGNLARPCLLGSKVSRWVGMAQITLLYWVFKKHCPSGWAGVRTCLTIAKETSPLLSDLKTSSRVLEMIERKSAFPLFKYGTKNWKPNDSKCNQSQQDLEKQGKLASIRR